MDTKKKNDGSLEITYRKTIDGNIIIDDFKYGLTENEFASVYGAEVSRLFFSDLPNFFLSNNNRKILMIGTSPKMEPTSYFKGLYLTIDGFDKMLHILKAANDRLNDIIEKVKNYKVEKIRIGDVFKDEVNALHETKLDPDDTSMETTYLNAIKDMN